jgi:transaldolase
VFSGAYRDKKVVGVFVRFFVQPVDYDNYGYETQILAASVRHTMHIVNCAKIGADVMTGHFRQWIIETSFNGYGLAQFVADFEKGNK